MVLSVVTDSLVCWVYHGYQRRPNTGHSPFIQSNNPTWPATAFRFELATPSQQPLNPLGLQSSHPLRPLVRNSGGNLCGNVAPAWCKKLGNGLEKCQESESCFTPGWWLSHSHTPRCESMEGISYPNHIQSYHKS